MIDNQPRRSIEFFKSPVNAGEAARAMPMSNGQIVSLYFLRAVIVGISSYLIFRLYPPTPQIAQQADPQMQAVSETISQFLTYYFSSPLFLTLAEFFGALLVTTVFIQISRIFTKDDVPWNVPQSAMARFLLVSGCIEVAVNLVNALIPNVIIGYLVVGFGIYMLCITILVYRGAVGLASTGQAVLVSVLTILAIFGFAFLFSIILSIVML